MGSFLNIPIRKNGQDVLAGWFNVLRSAGLEVSPPALVLDYAGSSVPTGYLLCDGSEVSRTTFAALFAIIGTAFGEGDGSTTFNVPKLKGRVPINTLFPTFHVNFNDETTIADIYRSHPGRTKGPLVALDTGFSGKGIDLDGNLNEVLAWDAKSANADHSNTITIRKMWNPSFVSFPGASGATGSHCLISLRDPLAASNIFPDASFSCGVELFVGGSSNTNFPKSFSVQIYNTAGTVIEQKDFGVFDRSLFSTFIEVELNLDFSTGTGRLFLDGVQFGTDFIWTSFIRTIPTNFEIILNTCLNNTTDIDSAVYDAVSIFDTIQHTAGYTPGTVEFPAMLPIIKT